MDVTKLNDMMGDISDVSSALAFMVKDLLKACEYDSDNLDNADKTLINEIKTNLNAIKELNSYL